MPVPVPVPVPCRAVPVPVPVPCPCPVPVPPCPCPCPGPVPGARRPRPCPCPCPGAGDLLRQASPPLRPALKPGPRPAPRTPSTPRPRRRSWVARTQAKREAPPPPGSGGGRCGQPRESGNASPPCDGRTAVPLRSNTVAARHHRGREPSALALLVRRLPTRPPRPQSRPTAACRTSSTRWSRGSWSTLTVAAAGVPASVVGYDSAGVAGVVATMFTLGLACFAEHELCLGNSTDRAGRTRRAPTAATTGSLPDSYVAGTETDTDWVVTAGLPGDRRPGRGATVVVRVRGQHPAPGGAAPAPVGGDPVDLGRRLGGDGRPSTATPRPAPPGRSVTVGGIATKGTDCHRRPPPASKSRGHRPPPRPCSPTPPPTPTCASPTPTAAPSTTRPCRPGRWPCPTSTSCPRPEGRRARW